MNKNCTICKEDITDLVHYTLAEKDGNTITVCDFCYQEISILEKRNGKWIEYIILDGIEYYLEQ